MGSPLSPIIADITLQDLEKRALNSLLFKPLFYYRYVDDIICAVHINDLDSLLNNFNSIHEKLQFIIEIGHNKINFLDVQLIINNNNITFNWFHKPTFSKRYLNFHSHHLLSQKTGIIYGLVDRIFLLSHP